MTHIANPSRVDQVGSLLRPQLLKEAYARHGNGEISDAELARIQDNSVEALIGNQDARGLSILSDGEFRRLNFQDSFVESVSSDEKTLQGHVDRHRPHL
jgi:5-methyltetrahydropteroyltriglutamate--homocysteine methyltransferase